MNNKGPIRSDGDCSAPSTPQGELVESIDNTLLTAKGVIEKLYSLAPASAQIGPLVVPLMADIDKAIDDVRSLTFIQSQDRELNFTKSQEFVLNPYDAKTRDWLARQSRCEKISLLVIEEYSNG